MGLKNWLVNFLGGAIVVDGDCTSTEEINGLMRSTAYREMALFNAIDLIARSICKCEIKTYKGGNEVRENLWYRWNVEPNANQSSSQFMRKLIYKLYAERECLVLVYKNQMYVADSFMRTEGDLKPDTFDGVTIGSTTLAGTYSASEVMYWNLANEIHGRDISSALDAVNDQYAKLLAYCMKAYQTSRGNKALFKYDALPPHVNSAQEGAAENWLKAQAKRYSDFIAADGGVAPIGKGVTLEQFGTNKTYSNESTRDIRAMLDDISDMTANALGIPAALLRGDVQGTSDALDLFLTACIDPLADFLREEIVRKEPTMGAAMLRNGNDLVFDTKQIKHIDLISMAANVDKLIASGICSINDIMRLIGEKPLDEEYADKHYITKNYIEIDGNLLEFGGEKE